MSLLTVNLRENLIEWREDEVMWRNEQVGVVHKSAQLPLKNNFSEGLFTECR